MNTTHATTSAPVVDMSFEQFTRRVEEALTALEQKPTDYRFQKQFCEEFREAKLEYELRIFPRFGTTYKNGAGAGAIMAMAKQALRLLESAGGDKAIQGSIIRHLNELAGLAPS